MKILLDSEQSYTNIENSMNILYIQHFSYIIITMNLNIQQIMKQSYHNHHPIATMHANVHTSTKHAMCISCRCACLLFTMHHIVPQWATLHH